MRAELMAFLSHLRLHYQFLILSGAYLSGAVFAGAPPGIDFLIQFLSVHVLLFGGVTVYNSYWDKDTGPIGGLRTPQPLAPWTLPASWAVQFLGLALAAFIRGPAVPVYAASMFCFWLYSRPGIRWKGRPLLSLVAIGAGTGVCGFLLGCLQGGRGAVTPEALAGSLGVACLIVSLFPLSQVYQVDEDVGRRDLTFTARYGLAGVRLAFAILFPVGTVLLAGAMAVVDPRLGGAFLALGGAAGAGVWLVLRKVRMDPGEYDRVMAVKYAASGLFSVFLGITLWMQSVGWIQGR
ncbi:MAG: UbiA family prenyltransferase [Fibrobacteria bacterium]